MGFGYVNDPVLDKMLAEERARAFIEFVHADANNLKAVTVILALCEKPKTEKEIIAYLRAMGASRQRIDNALNFIQWQGLGTDRTDGMIQAIPGAVSEIAYRIEHDGMQSSLPDFEEEADKIDQALAKVDAALAANGYRTVGKRRLRVVG